MRDLVVALVSLRVSARPEQRLVSVRPVQPVLAQVVVAQRWAAQRVATAPVDRRAELRCAQLVHPADRFARARSACRSFLVSARPE